MNAKIAGGVFVIESNYAKKEIETVQKYRPELLKLYADEKKENEIFAVSFGGAAAVNKYGVTFNEETPDERKVACVTLPLPKGEGNAKDRVAEAVGPALLNLARVEEQITGALAEIQAEKDTVAGMIEVI